MVRNMSEKQISIKIFAPKYWQDDKSFKFVKIEINRQIYDFKESSENKNLLETIINVNLTGSHSCELNYKFIYYYYYDGYYGKTNPKSVKIFFKNIKDELKLYFLNDLSLDSEKNKDMLNEIVDYTPNINLNNSNEKEDENEKNSNKNSAKSKLNPIFKNFLKGALIALLFAAAIIINILTFGTGTISLTLLGTVLATKIGISVLTSIFGITAISFLSIFIYNAYKNEMAKKLSNNIHIDKEDTLSNSQTQPTQNEPIPKSKTLWIDIDNTNGIFL